MNRLRLSFPPVAPLVCTGIVVLSGINARGDASGIAPSTQIPSSCSVTIPTDPRFIPPPPYPPTAPSRESFWHGNEGLWTMLRADGTWHGLPLNRSGFRQKVFWWRPGFDGRSEPSPELLVTASRLDAPASVVQITPATNAHNEGLGGWAMLTGVDVPTAGCWEFTGSYQGQTIWFVVWIHLRTRHDPQIS